jgi:hypothetical protein
MEAPPPASTLGAGDLIDGGWRLDLDHDDAQSPPPLNHPPTWNSGACAPSEDLGTPQSIGLGAGMAGKDAAPADAEDQDKACGLPIPATTLTLPNAKPDHDDAQSPPPLNHPPTWILGASAPSEDLGTPPSNGMGAGMVGRGAAAEAAENEDQAADARGPVPTEFEEEDEEQAQQEEDEGEEAEEEEEEEDEEEDENAEEGEAEEGAEDEAEEEDDQAVEEEEDNGDRDDDEKDPEDKDEADTRLSGG